MMIPLLAKPRQIGLLTGKVSDRSIPNRFADRQPVHAADAHDLFNHTGANFIVAVEFDATHSGQLTQGHALAINVHLRAVLSEHTVDVADRRHAQTDEDRYFDACCSPKISTQGPSACKGRRITRQAK